jgi:hypothetical protein
MQDTAGYNLPDNALRSSPAGSPSGPSDRSACAFSSVLGETHTRSEGFRELHRRLDRLFPDRCKIEAKIKDGATDCASLSKAVGMDSKVAVIVSGNPTKQLSTSEQQKLVDIIVDGGHLVVAASSGGFVGSNINNILSLFGISANTDSVIRSTFHKFVHPKQVFVADADVSHLLLESVAAHRGSSGVFSKRVHHIE